MADLAAQKPKDTYQHLLQVPGDVTAGAVTVQTGAGVALPVQIADDEVVFTATVDFTAATVVGLSGGGMAVGGTVTSGTAGRVLYVGAGSVLAEDDGLTYDGATNTLRTGTLKLTAGTINLDNGGLANQFSFTGGAGNVFFSTVGTAGTTVFGGGRIGFGSTHYIGWHSNTDGTGGGDLGLGRAATKVAELTGAAGGGGGTLRSVPLTPAQITADTNNYAPGVARYYRLSTDAGRNLTGLSVGQMDGQEAEIWNVGSNNLVLKHQDASSTAANRFICTGAADVTLATDEVALLRYDSTTSRWRVRKV